MTHEASVKNRARDLQRENGEVNKREREQQSPPSCSRDWSRCQRAADWLAFSTLPSAWLLPSLSSQQGVPRSPKPLNAPSTLLLRGWLAEYIITILSHATSLHLQRECHIVLQDTVFTIKR